MLLQRRTGAFVHAPTRRIRKKSKPPIAVSVHAANSRGDDSIALIPADIGVADGVTPDMFMFGASAPDCILSPAATVDYALDAHVNLESVLWDKMSWLVLLCGHLDACYILGAACHLLQRHRGKLPDCPESVLVASILGTAVVIGTPPHGYNFCNRGLTNLVLRDRIHRDIAGRPV